MARAVRASAIQKNAHELAKKATTHGMATHALMPAMQGWWALLLQ